MYRDVHGAALARAQAAHEELQILGEEDPDSPGEDHSLDELESLAARFEHKARVLRAARANATARRSPVERSPVAVSPERRAYGKALNDWYTLSRRVRANASALARAAAKRPEAVVVDELIGQRPRVDFDGPKEKVELARRTLERAVDRMQEALERIGVPALPAGPPPAFVPPALADLTLTSDFMLVVAPFVIATVVGIHAAFGFFPTVVHASVFATALVAQFFRVDRISVSSLGILLLREKGDPELIDWRDVTSVDAAPWGRLWRLRIGRVGRDTTVLMPVWRSARVDALVDAIRVGIAHCEGQRALCRAHPSIAA